MTFFNTTADNVMMSADGNMNNLLKNFFLECLSCMGIHLLITLILSSLTVLKWNNCITVRCCFFISSALYLVCMTMNHDGAVFKIFDFIKCFTIWIRLSDILVRGPSSSKPMEVHVNQLSNFPTYLLIAGERQSGKTSLFYSFNLDCIENGKKFLMGNNKNIHVCCIKNPTSNTSLEIFFENAVENMSALHSVLYCFSAECGFSRQDLDNLTMMRQKFGNQFIKNSLILVMVVGQLFTFDHEKLSDFEKKIKKINNEALRSILHECQWRCVPFQRNDVNFFKKRTLKSLIEKVEQIKHENANKAMDLIGIDSRREHDEKCRKLDINCSSRESCNLGSQDIEISSFALNWNGNSNSDTGDLEDPTIEVMDDIPTQEMGPENNADQPKRIAESQLSPYDSISARKRTFITANIKSPHSVEDLAESGFYHSGQENIVRCFKCGLTIENWGDDALETMQEHIYQSQYCQFVRDKVRARHST